VNVTRVAALCQLWPPATALATAREPHETKGASGVRILIDVGDLLGTSCSSSSACGGEGNLCVKSGSAKVCASECIDDAGCPGAYRCSSVASGGTLSSRKACVAR